MPGAGKSTVATLLMENGFSIITMGDVIREEAKRQNLEMTDTNLGNLMLKLRKDLGPGAVAQLILKKMQRESSETSNIVIDGIRSISEVKVLENIGHVKLLAIHASTHTRYKHIKKRARSDVPLNINDFVNRDKRELTVGVSEAIALADEIVSNNNLTKDELKEKVFAITQRWIDKINNNENDD
jgi:dephospho-CoA kinase